MPALLLVFVLLIALWIIRMTRDRRLDFNAARLLMSRDADGIWRESRRAVGELTAIVVSTWGFVYMVMSEHLTEWYVAAWMGILLGWAVFQKRSEVKDSKQQLEDDAK
jgi:hypothetical protein